MRNLTLLIALLLLAGCTEPKDRWAYLPAVGTPVPQFDLPTLDGGRISPASVVGSPTVFALWSTECKFSRAALRALAQMQSDYHDAGVRVVVLADDGDPTHVQQVLDDAGVTIPVAYADGELQKIFHPSKSATVRVAKALFGGVRFRLPSFVIVAPDGTVAARTSAVLFDANSLPQPGVEPENGRLDHVREEVDRLLAVRN